MNKIEVQVLNPYSVTTAEKMTILNARLTQRGHQISSMRDLIKLSNKPYTNETLQNICNLPHNNIKRFATINVAIVGASRRFLAQITRNKTGINFCSASLQYSNYSDNSDFVVPYELLDKEDLKEKYLNSCKQSMDNYKALNDVGIDNDSCGYAAPQGLRNVLIISANPVAWQQMISQRSCRRNTKETQYIMLLIWNELYKLNPILFGDCGPKCCLEGKFSCKKPCKNKKPSEILKEDFPLLYKEEPIDEN